MANPAASFPSSKNTDGGSALLPQVPKPEIAPINPSEQDGIVLGFRNESAQPRPTSLTKLIEWGQMTMAISRTMRSDQL